MPRVKKAVKSRQRRKKILDMAKGYRGGRGKLLRTATETVDRALKFAYRDRKAASAPSAASGSCASTRPHGTTG